MQAKTYETPSDIQIDIRIPAGSVVVRAQDVTTTTLEISGERDPDDVTIRFDSEDNGNRLVVEQRKKLRMFGLSRGLDVHLTVPHRAVISVQGGSTELSVEGTVGAVTFNSASGDATVGDVTGDASVKVASGDLSIGNVGGSLTFHSASGDVEAQSAAEQFIARTASGDVEVHRVITKVNVTTVSGDVNLRKFVAGDASLQAVSGDIEVGVAQGSQIFLDLSSISGSTQSDLPLSDIPEAEKTSSDGGGEGALKAATVSGDIRVRHSGVR